ncbi:chemotaxis protein [Halarcobacter ebronensis]|uniref:Chemotaxis protein n=1 Tax=Halarcobacter ebronensis TaxID=1462615 RepID=A0A4Q0YKJ1_9BACT|nr:cache domain-containing protein [Halarcobacter ebronensis]RXJ69561.1 chemotaxis protein [Halarcobacter ebronensis]
MFKNLSIKSKVLIISLIAIVIVSISISFESIYSINKLSKEKIEKFKEESYSNKEKELENYVSLALKTVESYYARTAIDKIKVEVQEDLKAQAKFLFSILDYEYNKYKDTLSTNELKSRLIEIIDGTRYGETGYFWVNDLDANIVVHPIKPQLNGKDLSEFKDKGGKRIFVEFANVAKKDGEGFVDYVWPKPGFEEPQPKVSFVKLFKPYGWVIGTGEYVSDVSASLKAEALKSISAMRYGQNGYFWINDSHPKMVMHPIKPSLDGKDLSKSKDPAGKFLFNEMVEVSKTKNKGGLVKYLWEKPGKEEPQKKFSYVKKFEPWDWIIGTGAYVDDIEENIIKMEAETNNDIKEVVIFTLVYTFISVLIVLSLFSFLIKRAIVKPLDDLNMAIIKVTSDDSSSSSQIEKKSNDEIGKVVDSFNAYIKKLQDGFKEDAKVIEEVENVIQKVNNGFYVYKVEKESSNPLVRQLRNSINTMIEGTNQKLEEINRILIEYGNSNFDYKSDTNDHKNSNGIIGSIYTSTRLLGGTISEFLAMITTTGEKLDGDTAVLSSSSSKLSTSANEQAASLEETAAAVEEITSIIKTSNEKVNRMSVLANDLSNSAQEGESLASKTTQAMDDIDKQVNAINEAITVIDQIAFQTNILSLNAAVEAATAGEAGKGFAVVAQEVRNLASRSADAAKEIKELVESATTKANEGKQIADNMISGYSSLNNKVNETIGLIADVTTASKEQESGIIQINDAVNSLDRATQVNASSATQISNLANEVSKLSTNLLDIADRAVFNKNKKKEICDIDLVFKICELKNDHIIFKNTNFAKVGTFETWSVNSATNCNFGKWILEQEKENCDFTKVTIWEEMKEYHEKVHNSVEEYVNLNAKKAPNNELEKVSRDLETYTAKLFDIMDMIKVERCKNISNDETKTNESSKKESKKVEVSPIPVPKKEEKPTKVKSEPKQVVANNHDDDEWESF